MEFKLFKNKFYLLNYIIFFIICFQVIYAEQDYQVSFIENKDDYTLLKITKQIEKTKDISLEKSQPSKDLHINIAVPPKATIKIESGKNENAGSIIFDSVMRDVRIIRIKIPFTFLKKTFSNEQTNEKQIYIKYQSPRIKAVPQITKCDEFEKIYKDILLNYPFPDAYYINQSEQKNSKLRLPFPKEDKIGLKVITKGEGLCPIAMSDIKGLLKSDFSISTNQIKVFNNAQEQTVYLKDDATSPTFYFKTEAIDNFYTNENVYWITVSAKSDNPSYKKFSIITENMQIIQPVQINVREIGELNLTTNQAKYLIITHKDFLESAEKLAKWRHDHNGFSTYIAEIEDIYDEFNYGIVDPNAVRNFLEYTYDNWQKPSPVYLTLLGDASENFKNDNPDLVENFVPTYYPNNDNSTANDDGFACFVSDGMIPAMLVGRIAVYENETANTIVDKIINYEKNQTFGLWRATISFLGDNEYEYLFKDEITSSIPKSFYRDEIYVKDYPFEDHYSLDEVKISPECNEEVIEKINEGCLSSHYVGHGGVTLLSHEKMFFYTDVPLLTNKDRLPFMIQLSCNTGYFDFPEIKWRESLSELLLAKKDGGAIGLFAGARKLGGSEEYLQEQIFEFMYAKAPTTFGVMTFEAKTNYIINKSKGHFINSYHLFGDPATTFNPPASDMQLSLNKTAFKNNKNDTLKIKGELSRSIDGKLIIATIIGNKIISTEEFVLKGDSFKQKIKIPKDLDEGKYNILCYAYDENQKYDVVGRAEIMLKAAVIKAKIETKDSADISLMDNKFEFVNPNVKDGDSVFIKAQIVNKGSIAAADTTARLYVKKVSDKDFKFYKMEKIGEILPAEIKKLDFRWDDYKTAGDTQFKIILEGLKKPKAAIDKKEFTQNLKIKTKANLALSPEDVKAEIKNGKLNIDFCVKNIGESDASETSTEIFLGTANAIVKQVGSDIAIPKIPVNSKSEIIHFEVSVEDISQEMDNIYFRLDAQTKLSESNEKDNVVKVKFR